MSSHDNLKRPHQLYKKTGHPRSSWVDDNLCRVFHEIFCPGTFEQADAEKVNRFKQAAMENKF